MSDSMSDYLAQDMQCEDLLECFYGLNELDREVFGVLAASEAPITVDNIAEEVDRERSTAYRSVQRLLDAGFIRKERINYEHGGYYHVFEPVPAGKVADPLQRLLNDWYAEVGQLIDEFREKYEEPPTAPAGN